jgi:hypothetical protein
LLAIQIASLYRIHSHIILSWARTILFALSEPLAGGDRGEHAIRALSPKASPITRPFNALRDANSGIPFRPNLLQSWYGSAGGQWYLLARCAGAHDRALMRTDFGGDR